MDAEHPSHGVAVVRNGVVTVLRGALLLGLATLVSCGKPEERAREDGWAWCRRPGIGRAVLCRTVEVPATETQTGPTVPISLVKVPAESDDRQADPVVLLAGGPGQSAIGAYGPMLPVFNDINRDRDILLIDVRGTSAGHALYCVPDAESDAAELDQLFRSSGIAHGAEVCNQRLDGETIAQLGHITTRQFVIDLEVVRETLGIARWNLIGASYGTRLAMQYAKAHPEHTRSLVLDAVAPRQLRLPLPFARDMESALEVVAARCREDAACLKHNGDPLVKMKTFFETLPKKMVVTHPRTGLRHEVEVTREAVAQLVRGPLYATDLQGLLPYAIRSAGEGDLSPLLGIAALMDQGSELSLGVLLSVTCAEDIPRIRPEEVGPATQGTVLGDTVVRDFMAACEKWRGTTYAPNQEPLPPSIPVLSLSGTVDPVTPVRWADVAMEGVQHHHRVVMAHAGHGILARGCVPRLVKGFLDAPTATVDASCVSDSKPPPFFIDHAGAAP